jgi:Ca2+-binding EF-hand superfamily protein
MSKINIHPTDRIATFQEVLKQFGMVTVGLLIFIFAFFIPMSQGMMSTETCNEITLECEVVDDDIFTVVIGYALSGCFSLILVAIWSQVLMAIIGKGKFVVDENNSVTLRTSKSGIRSSSSIQNMIMNRMAKGFMSSADLDGDGKISYEEALEMYIGEEFGSSGKPWEWDFKEAYERISKEFDLPPGNDPIPFDDYCVYTDSEDRTEFDKVDTDNDGIITKEQFIEMFWKGGNSELNEIRTHFDACDEDGDGFLSLEELANFMTGQDDNWAEEKPKVEEKSNDWWSEEED